MQMQKAATWLERVRLDFRAGLLSMTLGLCLAIYVFYAHVRDAWGYLPLRVVTGVGALWILFMLAAYLGFFRYAWPRLAPPGYPRQARWIWLAALVVSGTWLVSAIPVNLPRFYAGQSLKIEALGTRNPAARGEVVRLVRVVAGDGRAVPWDEFAREGDWHEGAGNLLSAAQAYPATLSWIYARPRALGDARNIKVVFATAPDAGLVRVYWNGDPMDADLFAASPGLRRLEFTPRPRSMPWFAWLFTLVTGVTFGCGLFILSAALAGPALNRSAVGQSGRHLGRRLSPAWRFGLCLLPPVIVWSTYLFVFWPAIMSEDSLAHWLQVTTQVYHAWHPPLYTWLIWLLTRLWASPAVVALFQILVLSALLSWGLGRLNRSPLYFPLGAAVLLSLVFAFSPVNGVLASSLWKDIPYSMATLGLSLIILEIVFSQGAWLRARRNVILLSGVAACVALFRHNGPPVAFGTLLVLAFIYRPSWRPLGAALVVSMGLWLGVRGPLYDLLHVSRNMPGSEFIMVSHLAAHVAAGTPLDESEKQVLSTLRPLDEPWPYDCYIVDSTIFDNGFDYGNLIQNGAAVRRVFWRTLWRAPAVNWKHLWCSSSLVWRVTMPEEGYVYRYNIWWDGQRVRYVSKNNLGLKEDSWLPPAGQIWFYEHVIRGLKGPLFWSAGLYLYLGLFLTVVGAFRLQRWKIGLYALPAVIQSVVLFVINPVQDFRYQYSVYLMALFAFSFLFIKRSVGGDRVNENQNRLT